MIWVLELWTLSHRLILSKSSFFRVFPFICKIKVLIPTIHIQSVSHRKSLSRARLFATPWTVACTKFLRPWGFLGKNTGVGCCLHRTWQIGGNSMHTCLLIEWMVKEFFISHFPMSFHWFLRSCFLMLFRYVVGGDGKGIGVCPVTQYSLWRQGLCELPYVYPTP